MLRLIRQSMIPAIALAIERDRTKRNQHVIDDSYDIGPLMADDKALAMIEPLGVFRMQTGPMLERTIYLDNVTLANPQLREGRIAWAEAPSSLWEDPEFSETVRRTLPWNRATS